MIYNSILKKNKNKDMTMKFLLEDEKHYLIKYLNFIKILLPFLLITFLYYQKITKFKLK